MFAHRYFTSDYFAPRYFPPKVAVAVVVQRGSARRARKMGWWKDFQDETERDIRNYDMLQAQKLQQELNRVMAEKAQADMLAKVLAREKEALLEKVSNVTSALEGTEVNRALSELKGMNVNPKMDAQKKAELLLRLQKGKEAKKKGKK
jgi:hypothetical protein